MIKIISDISVKSACLDQIIFPADLFSSRPNSFWRTGSYKIEAARKLAKKYSDRDPQSKDSLKDLYEDMRLYLAVLEPEFLDADKRCERENQVMPIFSISDNADFYMIRVDPRFMSFMIDTDGYLTITSDIRDEIMLRLHKSARTRDTEKVRDSLGMAIRFSPAKVAGMFYNMKRMPERTPDGYVEYFENILTDIYAENGYSLEECIDSAIDIFGVDASGTMLHSL
jgi:hypothetical protein